MADKMQTLICQEGNHEWTRPSQRGKPPRFCPNHQPTVEAPRAPKAKSESNSASAGSAPAAVNPFVLKAQKQAEQAKMAEVRNAKARAAAEHDKLDKEREQESMREEYKSIDARIENASKELADAKQKSAMAFKVADKLKPTDADYGEAIRIMDKTHNFETNKNNALLRLVARKRILEERLKGESKTLEQVADEVVPAENAGDYTDPGSKWNVEADMLDEVTPMSMDDTIVDSVEISEATNPAYVRREGEVIEKVCECCEREPTSADEEGWVIDPEEGVDLCPECAAELGALA